MKAIARYLPRDATLVLVIDQFEELFTLVADDAERDAFLEILRVAVLDERANVRVVVTMRADFFDRPLRFGDFGDLLSDATVPLPAATADGLRQMIEMPAARVGVGFEPGLVDRIAADVKDQPGALPLLEFSLTELFEQRATDVLAIAEYEQTGGVLGALGRRAESIYSRLDGEAKNVVRELFLRLVKVADAGRDTRRRVRRSELALLGIGSGAVDRVLQAFGDQRLLTFDRDPITRGPTVEVAHEAILSEWQRLAGWIEEHREDLLMRGRLGVAVGDWEVSGRSEEFLLSGGRLNQHEAWTATTELALSSAEQDFLDASRAAVERQQQARRRVRRRIMASLSAVTLVALAFGLVAWVQRRGAEHARFEAYAREISAQAAAQLEDDPELSELLAIESLRAALTAGIDPMGASTALRNALAANRVVARYEGGGFVDVSPDGTLFVTGSAEGDVIVRELDTGAEVTRLQRDDGTAFAATFSPDGQRIAVRYRAEEAPIWVWDKEGVLLMELPGPDASDYGPGVYLSFDDTGNILTAWFRDSVLVWSLRDGSLIRTIGAHGDARFIPGSDLLAICDTDPELANTDHPNHTLRLLDTATWDERAPIQLDAYPATMAVSPDGQLVVLAAPGASSVTAIEVSSGQDRWVQPNVSRPYGLAWLPESNQIAVGSDGGQVYLLDAETGDLVLTLDRGHSGSVYGVADAGQGMVLTSGLDNTAIMWDISEGPIAEVGSVATGVDNVRLAAYAPYPDQILVTDLGGTAEIIDAASLRPVYEIAQPVVGNRGR